MLKQNKFQRQLQEPKGTSKIIFEFGYGASPEPMVMEFIDESRTNSYKISGSEGVYNV